MQRPTDELIVGDVKLVEQFKEHGITAIFNLTQPGEHPYCGVGLKASGFTYSPENFMKAGIKHFNYAWKDMTTPTNFLMFDIVDDLFQNCAQNLQIQDCHLRTILGLG